jgi:hypothetical protein
VQTQGKEMSLKSSISSKYIKYTCRYTHIRRRFWIIYLLIRRFRHILAHAFVPEEETTGPTHTHTRTHTHTLTHTHTHAKKKNAIYKKSNACIATLRVRVFICRKIGLYCISTQLQCSYSGYKLTAHIRTHTHTHTHTKSLTLEGA